MAMETENYGLYLEDSDKTTFKDWRNKINGPNGSNMEKIDKVLCDKQDKITGTIGQVVGFDKDGNAVAQPAPDTGVTTFNGRKGGVVPQDGDYTAEMVGARPAGWTPTAADVGAPTLDEMNAAIQTAASGIDVGVTTFNGRKGAVTPASGDYTAAQVGAVPTTRKVNNKPLSSDITLSASDVGALSTSGGTIDGDLTITEGHAIKFDLIKVGS